MTELATRPPRTPMTDMAIRAATITAGLDTADKIRMVSGRDFWNTESIESAGVPAMMLTDGPHGLRKQAGSADHIGIADSVPATCFPTAVGLGSSWDTALLEEIGVALGVESRTEDVSVLLGPGLNIKRHPAGGRAFEYLSEDPFLSGTMAGALVRGIQSQGVGACLKHFAANNQESNRMRVDTLVDERTLRELYLTGFEIAVKTSNPWTVMSSYNRLNGEHTGETRRLFTEILRDEWGFDGLVMTDWLATFDRPTAIDAGVDLEMPGSAGVWDERIAAAVASGTLPLESLDRACARVIELALRTSEAQAAVSTPLDLDAHHALARRAAAAGSVLLVNDGILPLAATGTIALIGALAETPRYQGAGSSLVKPTRLDTVLDSMRARIGADATLTYAPGYDAATGASTRALLEEARSTAQTADVVVLMVGLPPSHESEGFDRTTLDIPQGMLNVVAAVLDVNPNTAVVLVNGSAVELPWVKRPAAILEAYLGGQAAGSAIVDVLFGDAEPGGRLAESFPVSATDLPSSKNFATHPTQVEYREGLNVGYRFHDTWDVPALFPFGHGLSYTSFTYGTPTVTGTGTDLTVKVRVTNTGKRAGTEVVQVYIHDPESSVVRPLQELKGFAKVNLAAGASTDVSIPLDRRSFAVYDVVSAGWKVEAGEFEIRVGASSVDIRGAVTVDIASNDVVTRVFGTAAPVATDREFARLIGRPIPRPAALLPFTYDSTIEDLSQTRLGRLFASALMRQAKKLFPTEEDPEVAKATESFLVSMPLRGIAMTSNGAMSLKRLDTVIRLLNSTLRRRA